ncbi:MAG: hypothetical protein EBQ96_01940 [Proteobacteria bacterium]|nr:hypothetical protein [Pseudomonadota bacterium]
MRRSAAAVLVALVTVFGSSAADAGDLKAGVTVVEPRVYDMTPKDADIALKQQRLEAGLAAILKPLIEASGGAIRGDTTIRDLKVHQFVEKGYTTEFTADATLANGLTLSLVSGVKDRRYSVRLTSGSRERGDFKVIWSFGNHYGNNSWNGSYDNQPVTGKWAKLAEAVGVEAEKAAADLAQLMAGMRIPPKATPKLDHFRH